MEPTKQIEIQLGHMCNNRCVFCVSGQETALGRARPLDVSPILAEITKAYEGGHRKLTLLGGEPTLQPGFMTVVRHAVKTGFDDVVIFTNGVKTSRESFIDEVLETGGRFTWRLSLQGATKESHERTTRKDGSFDRLEETMTWLRKKGERLTINMCVVQSNYESVAEFPKMVNEYGAVQLHLDMVRPLDAGVRTEDEFRGMIPRYSDMVPALTKMMDGFPEGFDANVGNLPYCVAPHLARWIHHDGQRTLTIAVDGATDFSKPWDKYLVKRRDKVKPDSCASCVFDGRCSGVFEMYEQFYGADEFKPVTLEKLREVDPKRWFLPLHIKPFVARALRWTPPAPFTTIAAKETGDQEITITISSKEQGAVDPIIVVLRPPPYGVGSFDLFGFDVVAAPRDRALALSVLRGLWAELAKEVLAAGHRVLHPVGNDALGGVARSIVARLDRLRASAPFGELDWRDVVVSNAGRRAEAIFVGPAGERAGVWFAEENGRPTGGYRVEGGQPSPAVVEGLRLVMASLRPRTEAGARSVESSM
jgi:MoaA/NifB/PqqE/SkfB family radical SAM enzyme